MNLNLGDMLGGSNPLQAARSQVDDVIGQAVDRLAGLVPGGEKYAPQAKQAISSALDNLQQQLMQEASRRLGGGQ